MRTPFKTYGRRVRVFARKVARVAAVSVLVCGMFASNMPTGFLTYALESWQDSNVVDLLWQAQHSSNIVDTFGTETAYAAQVAIDTSVNTTDYGQPGPGVVWTSATNGYVFYRDSGGGISMSSTTNSGVSWSTARNVDSVNTTDAGSVAVWWDGWTGSGSVTQYIHIATLDTTVDDIYYTRLDTTTGGFSTSVLATTQSGAIAVGTNYAAITKAENGVLYMAAASAVDSWVVSCSVTCTTAGNWSERTNGWVSTDRGEDVPLLSPVGGTNNIMLLNWDTSANSIEYNVYSATSSSWWFSATTTVVSSKEDNTTYEGQMIGLAHNGLTGNTYVALVDDADNYTSGQGDHDINVLMYASTTGWTTKTNPVTTASGGLTGAKIGIDKSTGDLYVSYVRRTTLTTATTGRVYYRSSTDDGTSWSGESAQLNTTADNLFFFNMSPSTPVSPNSNPLSVIWKYITTTADDLYHEFVVPPITPPTLTTTAESAVVATSSTIGGNITNTGGANATERGFATSTNSALSSSVSTTTDTGSFSTGAWTAGFSNTDLVGNTTYYYRPYATGPGGTGYGSIGSLLTRPDIPGTPTYGSVTQTSIAVSWSTPTGGATSYTLQRCITSTVTCVRTTLASSPQSVGSLTAGTSYDFAVQGVNATGVGLWSATSTQLTSPAAPTVTTSAATSITATSSTLGGNITATGGVNATARGFASSTSSTLSSGVSTSTESGSFSTGAFTGSMGGLTGNTTYYFRAYAGNSGGSFAALNATGAAKFWTGVSVSSSTGDVYATVSSGDIYKQTAGAGSFDALNATGGINSWTGVSVNPTTGDVYATASGVDVYKQTAGAGSFNALGAGGAVSWGGVSVNSSTGDVYATVGGVDIYKQTAGTGSFDALNATGAAKSWVGVSVNSSTGDVYAAVNGGDIYKQTAGAGDFVALNATGGTRDWVGVSVNPATGDVYATVYGGDIYKQTAGTGSFVGLNASGATKDWYGVSVNPATGEVYAAAQAVDIYKQSNIGMGSIQSFLTPPNIPGTPTFSSITGTGMRVSWTAPSGGATTYKLERCTGSGCTDYASVSTGIAALFYDDSGLSGVTTYRYRVRATNATGDGVYSAGAEQVTGAAPPTLTTQAATLVAETTATLNATITATNGANASVRGFGYSTSASFAFNVATTTNNGDYGVGAFSDNVSSLVGNLVYYFRPYATNTGGTGYGSTELFLTYPGAPGSPSYSATAATSTGVSWNAANGGASTYQLTQCLAAACSVFSSILSTATTTYSLVGNTTYSYAVRGFNATGYSAFSATTTRLTVPNVPGTPSFSNVEGTTLTLSWSGSVGSSSSYKVERCTGSNCSDFTQIASGVGTTTYNDTGLMGATTYRYRVQGTNATGDGLYSAGAETITDTTPPTVVTDAATSLLTFGATLNGTVSVTGGASITTRGFAWSLNASLAASTATTTEAGTFNTGAFEALLQSLTSQTTYYFRAYAINAIGTSFGAIVSFITAEASRGGGGSVGGDAPAGQGIVTGGDEGGGGDIGGGPPEGDGDQGGGGGGGGGEI